MRRKVLSLFLVMAFVAVAAISSTLAYFTDTDHADNVFTLGKVDVELVEQQIGTDGSLEDFTNDKPLYPAVYYGEPAYDKTVTTPNGDTVAIWGPSVSNVQDKIVSVKNTGASEAYIRVIFAFEDKLNEDGTYISEMIHTRFNDVDLVGGEVEQLTDENGVPVLVTLMDGDVSTNYSIFTYTYESAIAPGQFTPASLLQIYLDPEAGNNFFDAVGRRYDVKVVAQAVQSEGFQNSVHAFNAAFGEVNAEDCAEMFAQTN